MAEGVEQGSELAQQLLWSRILSLETIDAQVSQIGDLLAKIVEVQAGVSSARSIGASKRLIDVVQREPWHQIGQGYLRWIGDRA